MSDASENIVNLTDRFTLAPHSGLPDMVGIDLPTDDSIIDVSSSLENNSVTGNLIDSYGISNRRQDITKKRSQVNRNSINEDIQQQRLDDNDTDSDILRYFVCYICREGWGKVSIVSTKCGHLFCIECIKNSLQKSQTCPSCKGVLKGDSAYHPVYL